MIMQPSQCVDMNRCRAEGLGERNTRKKIIGWVACTRNLPFPTCIFPCTIAPVDPSSRQVLLLYHGRVGSLVSFVL